MANKHVEDIDYRNSIHNERWIDCGGGNMISRNTDLLIDLYMYSASICYVFAHLIKLDLWAFNVEALNCHIEKQLVYRLTIFN